MLKALKTGGAKVSICRHYNIADCEMNIVIADFRLPIRSLPICKKALIQSNGRKAKPAIGNWQ
jgi:hypothetical protein